MSVLPYQCGAINHNSVSKRLSNSTGQCAPLVWCALGPNLFLAVVYAG